MKLSSRASGWLGGAVLILLVGVALFLQTGARPGSGIRGSIGSAEDDGRRALALLLLRVRIRAEGWRQVPAALPPGRHAVWIAGGPEPEDRPGSERRPRALPDVGMHAPAHYATFVERGGTLLVEGARGIEFLRDRLDIEAAQGLELATLDGEGPRDVRLRSGEVLRVAANLAFQPLDPSSPAREVAVVVGGGGSGDAALAVEIPCGAGRAIAIADGRPFDNGSIGALDHALLAVRLAEEAPPGGRLFLDEYALGLWEPSGPLDVAARPALLLFTLNALVLVLLWTWMRAAPRAFPRDPEPLESFSPLLRARAVARLYERADHVSLLAPAARAAACDRLAATLRLPRRREGGEAGGPSPADVARIAAALGPDLGPRAIEALRERRVATRADLERLARDLRSLELEARQRTAQDHGDRPAELGG